MSRLSSSYPAKFWWNFVLHYELVNLTLVTAFHLITLVGVSVVFISFVGPILRALWCSENKRPLPKDASVLQTMAFAPNPYASAQLAALNAQHEKRKRAGSTADLDEEQA